MSHHNISNITIYKSYHIYDITSQFIQSLVTFLIPEQRRNNHIFYQMSAYFFFSHDSISHFLKHIRNTKQYLFYRKFLLYSFTPVRSYVPCFHLHPGTNKQQQYFYHISHIFSVVYLHLSTVP